MKELNRHLAEIDEKLLHLKVSLDQANQRGRALELVVSWMLAHQPDDAANTFLAMQAFALEDADGKTRHSEAVALLDDLRESVREWRVQPRGAHTPPQE